MPGSALPRRPGRADVRPDNQVAIVTGLRRIVKALETYSRAVQREFGLTGPQLWAIKVLARGQLTAGELAQALVVHQSSVSVLVERLERRGLVRRTRDPDDRRVVHVALTAAGAALAARAPAPAQGRLLHGLRTMPAGELGAMRGAVDRLVNLMEVDDVNATFFFAED